MLTLVTSVWQVFTRQRSVADKARLASPASREKWVALHCSLSYSVRALRHTTHAEHTCPLVGIASAADVSEAFVHASCGLQRERESEKARERERDRATCREAGYSTNLMLMFPGIHLSFSQRVTMDIWWSSMERDLLREREREREREIYPACAVAASLMLLRRKHDRCAKSWQGETREVGRC